MKQEKFKLVCVFIILVFSMGILAQDDEEECNLEPDQRTFQAGFGTSDCRFMTRHFRFRSPNEYFIMEPGWQVVLEGEDGDEFVRVETTVLAETQKIAGVLTRVVEEREFKDGELYEVSRNFYAICAQTNDIYYFGEDVDFYEDGEIVSHHGAWRVGVNGAQPGILMPGRPMIGARFYQEYSIDEAEDRAEVMGYTEMEVAGQEFERVLMLLESNPLDSPCSAELKYYAPGIGNIIDEELVEYGFVFRVPPVSWIKK